MQKGQAFALSNDTFSLPHGTSLVLVPLGSNGVIQEFVSPVFDSKLATGGTVSLSSLVSRGIEKLFVISKSSIGNIECHFNGESVTASPDVQDSTKTWVSFSIYKHKDIWKVRFVNELVSGNEMLLKYLRVNQSIDLITLCEKEYSAANTLKDQARSIAGSRSANDVKKGTSMLAKSLANEGMSIFKKLKGKVSTTASQVKNQKFLDAACAVSAVVAFADGYASPEELQKLLSVVRTDDVLSVYSESEIRASFERFVSHLKADHIVGEGKAMTAISVFAGKPEANALLAIGLGIAMAEHGVDEDEREAIVRISNTLNISAEDLLGRVS